MTSEGDDGANFVRAEMNSLFTGGRGAPLRAGSVNVPPPIPVVDEMQTFVFDLARTQRHLDLLAT